MVIIVYKKVGEYLIGIIYQSVKGGLNYLGIINYRCKLIKSSF